MVVEKYHKMGIAKSRIRVLFEYGMEQAAKVQPLTGKELEKFCAREDKYRADYYKHHTGHEWTDAMNYDLCLDSSKLGFDKCVEAIKAHAKVRFGEDVFD